MKKVISKKCTYAVFIVLIVGIYICLKLNYSPLYGIFLGLLCAYILSYFNGYSHKEIFYMMTKGLKSVSIVILMMIIISILIGIWMLNGTIPTIMHMGFSYLSHLNFVLVAFLITSIISIILGTSLGSISTIGMALMGIGKSLHISTPLLAGAIVSASYIGDRSSPLSSSANLTAIITKTNLMDNLKHMMTTLIPSYILCIIFYTFMGKKNMGITPLEKIITLQNILSTHFFISCFLLISPFLILIMALFRYSMIKSLSTGLMVSLFITLFIEQFSISKIIYVSFWGFHSNHPQISSIVSGGGIFSMRYIILIIVASTALTGILDGTNMIQPIIDTFIKKVKSTGNLILKTSFLSLIIAFITSNQTISIIIPGKFLQTHFERKNISKNTLARTLADTAIVLVPLIPSNSNAIFIMTLFHVNVLDFAPFSIFCYITPILTIFYGYMGWIRKSSYHNHCS
ncbi:Na+/H+ antiporter NhaC family protein [Inediibacterium massiliense]|uniref:Na+/H+ antiporter NhaC family protein n=1 Tax=Inediibacterium massiliense TaxID=1658111 RepID=UPI0006B40564|nr:Na+/H+ antiporter NhaC family protein [Inediibacterium massiliense]